MSTEGVAAGDAGTVDVGRHVAGRYAVGERVQRPADVFAASSPMRRGIVVRCYAEDGYDELYEVEWTVEGGKPLDPAVVGRGYFWWGIDRDHTPPWVAAAARDDGGGA